LHDSTDARGGADDDAGTIRITQIAKLVAALIVAERPDQAGRGDPALSLVFAEPSELGHGHIVADADDDRDRFTARQPIAGPGALANNKPIADGVALFLLLL